MSDCFYRGENPIFSILICSIQWRKNLLNRLFSVLKPQLTSQVEVLVNADRGELPIGKKRNLLIKDCNVTSKYLAFVDDDDTVSDLYVSKVLGALESNPDCCGMEGTITFDGKNPKTFIHSLKYDHWYEENGIYYRSPNHLNPIKREIVVQVPFIETNHGEDADFSNRIFSLLKDEVYIEGNIYNYLYQSKGQVIRPVLKAPPRIVPRLIRKR